MPLNIERLAASLSDTSFACPQCGYVEDGEDSDNAELVVSLWGEEHHDFTCSHCDFDYRVQETVHRTFEAIDTNQDQ